MPLAKEKLTQNFGLLLGTKIALFFEGIIALDHNNSCSFADARLPPTTTSFSSQVAEVVGLCMWIAGGFFPSLI